MADVFNDVKELISGTQDVFSTMLMVDLKSEDAVENKSCPVTSNLTSMIGLGGGIRGMLAIHCPAAAAKSITGAFLGMEVTDLDDDVKDAIGEIANMIAGNLKVAYAQVGINIALSIPTSVIGESFSVSGITDARRLVVPFVMAEERFWLELLYVVNG